MSSNDVVIVSGARTPVGSFNGSLSTLSASALGSIAIKAALERAKVAPADVEEVLMGNVLGAAQGMGPARQAAIAAGIPHERTAYTINQICGSGLRSVANAYMAIKAGEAQLLVAGGMESMSCSPHAIHLRNGTKMGNATLIDVMISDGLTDIFNKCHMGVTAENVAKQYGITREEQDTFAVLSQTKAEAAIKAGKFKDEICPVTIQDRKGDKIVDQDEYPRFGATVEAMAKLKPAFAKDGTVTAGNASGINDGAAAFVLMSAAEASKRGLTPLVRVAGWATRGVDPAVMGTGPIPTCKALLQNIGWSVDQLDVIEANEAFAAQAIAVNRDMGWDLNRVNVNGGAIAIGHPIGASGSRILATLIYEMIHSDKKRGLATLCIGGGMGIAVAVER